MRSKLEWYALREDFNSHKLVNHNVLGGLEEEIKKRVKRDKITKFEDFRDSISSLFKYYYYSKAEHELLVSGLFSRDKEHIYKIDVWTQLEPNIDRISEYIIKTLKLNIE